MSYLHLNTQAAELITAHGNNSNKGDSLVAKLSALLPYTAFKKAECESDELFDEVKTAVAAAFTKRERTLLAYTRAEAGPLNELKRRIGKRPSKRSGRDAATCTKR